MIQKIRLRNYRSFSDTTFDFLGKNGKPKNLIILYGANGSGKTNLINVFQLLGQTFHTISIHNQIMSILDKEDIDKRQFFLSQILSDYNMEGIIKKNKTINSTSNMIIDIEFLLDGKTGSYSIEFDDTKIVREKLEYTLSKHRGSYFEIAENIEKYNTTIFQNDYLKELKDLKKRYWGKHSIISLLLFSKEEYSEEFFNNGLDNKLQNVLDYLINICYHLVNNISKKESIGHFSNLLKDFDKGTINPIEKDNLKRTEKMINDFFTNLYQDIKKVKYFTAEKDNLLYYELEFHKMISGKVIPVKYTQESCGTKTLLKLLPFFLAANDGVVSAIDEIDNGIHDLLLLDLIKRVVPTINGQIIMTTHNTLFLDEYELKNSIYFINTDKNGNKTINTLTDTDYRVQKSSNVLARYYDGQFGGIPIINDSFAFEKICQYIQQE